MNVNILGLVTVFCFFIGAGISEGATIYLKNGRSMEGVIKGQDAKGVQLDIGGGVVTISKSKIERIDDGEGEAEEELSEKMLRKVILTRKNAPKELLPYVYEYNDIREELKMILKYNDEVKIIVGDRSQIVKKMGAIEKEVGDLDRKLEAGRSALGLSTYNKYVTRQNTLYGQARSLSERQQWGIQRLQVLRGKIGTFRKRLGEFVVRVTLAYTSLKEPDEKTKLFFNELVLRVGAVASQVKGKHRKGLQNEVEVVLNGTYKRKMVVDTGASTVVISRSIAEKLGLELKENQAFESVLADGKKVKSYMVVLESVSVDGMRAEQVIGSVIDDTSYNFTPLLGMTYLQNFEVSIDGDTGLIELSETSF